MASTLPLPLPLPLPVPLPSLLKTETLPASCLFHKSNTKRGEGAPQKIQFSASSSFHTSTTNRGEGAPKNIQSSKSDSISNLCREGLLGEAFAVLTKIESYELSVIPEIYGELLQGCVYERALFEGCQIHAHLLKSGTLFYENVYIQTKLIIFYAKCNCLALAEQLFSRQRHHNLFSWAAMIGLYSRLGFSDKALIGFVQMLEAGAFPDNFVIPNALKACSELELVGFGRGIHSYALKMGFAYCVYVLSSLVDFYGKCGVPEEARKIFDEMPEKNVITWNSLLVGYSYNGLYEEVLELFCLMRNEGIQQTRVSISCFLSASANLGVVNEGRQGHSLAVLNGLGLDCILGSSLVNFYCKVGMIVEAEHVFHGMADKDVVAWNLLISGYVQNGLTEKALCACHRMRKENFKFDCVTLASIISASTCAGILELGKVGHGYCIRNSFESDLVIASSIIDFYASCYRIDCARQVFDLINKKDLVLWNAMIYAYAQHCMSGEASKLFYQMQLSSIAPNVVSYNSVILAYLRNRQVREAKDMFSEMQISGVSPDIITWTTLIYGLAENGFNYEAMELYGQMQEWSLTPSPVTIVGVLLACTNVVSLRYGKAMHGHVMRQGFLSSQFVATSLVDMYAKCGSINLAERVFKLISEKKLPLFNVMISGYALHGRAKEALIQYKDMLQQGLQPDEITFTGLLSACSHAGLVNEGLNIFSDMVSLYRLTPQKEHCGCLVTLLSRCGEIREALRVISTMSITPDAHILASLLAVCKKNDEIDFGEYLSERLFDLEPRNLANYATLANIYSALGKWQESSAVRVLIRHSEHVKNPGCSWLQIGKELHAFIAGDKSHPLMDIMTETLLCLHGEMRYIGCPSTIASKEHFGAKLNLFTFENKVECFEYR